MRTLQGKTALVTGAAGGMGRIVKALQKRGVTVMGVDAFVLQKLRGIFQDALLFLLSDKGIHYMNPANPFKWRHYEGEIILLCVRWYLRYFLSYRDLEEIIRERGLSVDRTTICR